MKSRHDNANSFPLWRHHRLILIIVIFPCFFALAPWGTESRILQEIWDLGHVVFFAVFARECLVWLHATGWSSRAVYGTAFLAVCAVALTIEFGQSFVDGRDSNLRDLAFGIIGGYFILTWQGGVGLTVPRKVLLRLTGITALLGCFIPLSFTLADEYRMRRNFPVLSDFESFLDVSRWDGDARISRVTHPVNNGRFSLKVTLTTAEYSGLALRYFPRDWSTVHALSFSIYNPEEPVMVYYRVHDSAHQGENQHYDNRYNGNSMLQPGWNHLNISIDEIVSGPKKRIMDSTNIRGFLFFVFQQPVPRVFFLDDVQLFPK